MKQKQPNLNPTDVFSIQFIYTTKIFSFYLNHLLNYKAYCKLKAYSHFVLTADNLKRV